MNKNYSLTRFVLVLSPIFALLFMFAGMLAGRYISANMSGAKVEIETDRRFEGTYSVGSVADLSEVHQNYIGADAVLLLQNDPRWARNTGRVMLRVTDTKLARSLKANPRTRVKILEARFIKRYPAKLFAWLGPVRSTMFDLEIGYGYPTLKDGFSIVEIIASKS